MIKERDRVVGGIPTSEYPDCVAIGSSDGWCCTGTLIAPNVVITAGHCHGSCSDRVFVGEDVERPGDGTIIEVEDAVRHPDYDDNELRNDLAVLILAEDAAAQPRSLAADGMLEAAGSVRLAGYGNTDVDSMGGYGIRRMVDVPLASNDPKFGSDAKTEFVPARPLWTATAATATAAGLPTLRRTIAGMSSERRHGRPQARSAGAAMEGSTLAWAYSPTGFDRSRAGAGTENLIASRPRSCPRRSHSPAG